MKNLHDFINENLRLFNLLVSDGVSPEIASEVLEDETETPDHPAMTLIDKSVNNEPSQSK